MANKVQQSGFNSIYEYFKVFDGFEGRKYKAWELEIIFDLDKASAECVMKRLLPDGSQEIEIDKLVQSFLHLVRGLSPGNNPDKSYYKTKVPPEGIKFVAENAIDMFSNYHDAFSRGQMGNKKNQIDEPAFI